MAALGDEFRSAREARGLTLSDVAERLHIRDVYLAAIENEQWDAIGAAVYVRGFLRTYARFLGLDPEDAVARFTAAAPAGPPARSVDVTKGGRAAAAAAAAGTSGDRRALSVPALFAILVAVALIAFAGYEYYRYRAEPPGTAPQAAATATATAAAAATAEASALGAAPVAGASAEPGPSASPAAAGSPGATAAPSATVKRGLTLRLVQPSWLRVTVDGTVREEGTFPAGTTRTFVGKTVTLRVGNAGGVAVSLNGAQPAVLGAAGDVVERQYTLSGG